MTASLPIPTAAAAGRNWPGKGNVARRMFADIDADVHLLVDGDRAAR
ncbi:MAG: hypothetical protein M9907_05875 [Burkholderiaceae bacterium]|nr:hypothetical protein [Burkholderiaceae bacterium]